MKNMFLSQEDLHILIDDSDIGSLEKGIVLEGSILSPEGKKILPLKISVNDESNLRQSIYFMEKNYSPSFEKMDEVKLGMAPSAIESLKKYGNITSNTKGKVAYFHFPSEGDISYKILEEYIDKQNSQ